MNWWKKGFWGVVGVLFLSAASVAFRIGGNAPSPSAPSVEKGFVEMAGESFIVEMATTSGKQSKGLSGRPSLPEGTGMFFWFTEDGKYPFWMPDMHFPIDIVWIDKEYRIVHVEPNVQPNSFPSTFSSPIPARYVLEVPAGTMARIGAKIGEKIDMHFGAP